MRLDARCWVLNAFDLARSISLVRCREALTTREVVAPRRPEWPHLFGLDQRPLVWSPESTRLILGTLELDLQPRAIIYDFGNVSVALGCRIEGSLERLRDVSVALRHAPELPALARRVVDEFVSRVGDALEDPRINEESAQYTVFQLDHVDGASAVDWLRENAGPIAQVVRAETVRLAEEEVADALARRISYSQVDASVIDGSSAFLIDREFEETLAVLDFANCERLSMGVLDDELDGAVVQASRLVHSRVWRWRSILTPWGRNLRRLSQLTFDAAAEFEALENAIKLTGDHYLARIYRIALDRFDLTPFREGIARKLDTLWNFQQVVLDQSSTRRSELLELIIIALIAVEILHAFG